VKVPKSTNNKYAAVPLTIDDMTFRGGAAWLNTLGVYVLDGKIVYLYEGLQEVPLEDPVKDTIFPKLIIADFFSLDFKEHTQKYIAYKERKTLYTSCAKCSFDSDRILLNTMHYIPTGYYHGNGEWGAAKSHEDSALAKLIEIRVGTIREVGDSPKPIEKTHSDKKLHYFGDYVLRMVSPFKLECKLAATGNVVWEMRLSAYLYTDFELIDGVLYFGTAGKGGRFYGVSLSDGREIFSYDTGGTTYWSWHKNYVQLSDRKGDILFLDPKNGVVVKRLHFRGLSASVGIIHENCIYTTARDKNHSLYALSAEIGDELEETI